ASSTGSVVFGGSQPVVGALVTLYEAGTAGYGGEPLILASATSGAGGRFPGLSFTCSSAASELYIVADGGNGGGGTNNKISLMAALGRCDSLPPFVNINEVTTVVSTYALAQFMSTINPENIGTSSTNLIGMEHAAGVVPRLVDLSTGQVLPQVPPNPTDNINSLANILSACVDSNGAPGSPCDDLFNAVHEAPTSPPIPTSTLQAILFEALHSGNVTANGNVAALFALQTSGGTPYTPALAAAPTDWSVSRRYTGGGLSAPRFVAIDSFGNVWMANRDVPSVSKFSPLGDALSPASGFTGGGINGA